MHFINSFVDIQKKTAKAFAEDSHLTDDSMMTIAVGCACAKADLCNEEDFKSWAIYYMRKIGREFPFAGRNILFESISHFRRKSDNEYIL